MLFYYLNVEIKNKIISLSKRWVRTAATRSAGTICWMTELSLQTRVIYIYVIKCD